jgi:hypothetical protein
MKDKSAAIIIDGRKGFAPISRTKCGSPPSNNPIKSIKTNQEFQLSRSPIKAANPITDMAIPRNSGTKKARL